MSLGEGFGVGFRKVVGGGLPLKNEGKGEGGGEGGGWGGDRQRNRQVNAQALSKLPFSNLPFSFSPTLGNGLVCVQHSCGLGSGLLSWVQGLN